MGHPASCTMAGVPAPCSAHPSKEPICQPQQKQVCLPAEARAGQVGHWGF